MKTARCNYRGCTAELPMRESYVPLPPDGERYQQRFEVDPNAVRAHQAEHNAAGRRAGRPAARLRAL